MGELSLLDLKRDRRKGNIIVLSKLLQKSKCLAVEAGNVDLIRSLVTELGVARSHATSHQAPSSDDFFSSNSRSNLTYLVLHTGSGIVLVDWISLALVLACFEFLSHGLLGGRAFFVFDGIEGFQLVASEIVRLRASHDFDGVGARHEGGDGGNDDE